jgi:hypothetical protein
MRTRTIAFLQLMLIFPAALFMASLVVRSLGPLRYELAHTAQQIVMWYAERLWTLKVLLFALPCMALLTGSVTLRSRNRGTEQHDTQRSLASDRPGWPMRLVSVTTVASAGILAIVGFHALTR